MRVRDEQGFTLVEVSIGALLAAIVGTLLMATLVSAQQGERHIEEMSASREDLRRAMHEILKDVRAAEPLWFDGSTTPAADPEQELRLVHNPPGSTTPTYVRWHIDGTELVRDVVTVNGLNQIQTVATTYRLPGVDTAVTAFAYDGRGGAVNVAGPAVDWNQLNHCTNRITVVLRAATLRDRHPFSVSSQSQLRNNAEPPVFCP